ncbi:MAG: aminotransferase class V-fold PLP-dependent enzyme [Saccharofermentanales bacterium]|jgi:cysteine desulfurase family protein
MIYFDNSATTLMKPPEVSAAVKYGIESFGNAGRSFHEPMLLANRAIYHTRELIAQLIGLADPLGVAFTSSATESLNLVIQSLIDTEDHVITSVAEHNSVLRPLYLRGCSLSFIECNEAGELLTDSISQLITPATKAVVISHGSNLTGNVIDLDAVKQICTEHELLLVVDISQTFGSCPITIDQADVFCFTGHKGLFGPQGTGGIIVGQPLNFRLVKTGGSGDNSFAAFQQQEMPDIFEAGTLNAPGIYGLGAGVEFLLQEGRDKIRNREYTLTNSFYQALKDLPELVFYGNYQATDRLPLVSLNLQDISSTEVSTRLWQQYQIATRAGSHCAPRLHQHFATIDQGIVRFSFSYFNTEAEIEQGISALKNIIKEIY